LIFFRKIVKNNLGRGINKKNEGNCEKNNKCQKNA